MKRWREWPSWVQAAVAAVAVLIVINIGLGLLDGATRGADQSGERASSFSTASTGTAAYAELLERIGHDTVRTRGSVRPETLDPATTVLVFDADAPSESEQRAIADFVRAGGRLVAGGEQATEWAAGLPDTDVTWEPRGSRTPRTRVDGDLYRVRTDGTGSWVRAQVPRLTVRTTADAGTVLLVADTSPLQNRRLDEADNAAFGVALAGEDDRPVAFVEGPHGFGSASGLDAIPDRWKVALVGGALAALLTLIAASRRLGPAEETVRRLAPARRAYVDALGVALARTRRPVEAIAPLQAAARAQLARRAGLPADAPPEVLREAAVRAGWTTTEIDALFAPASDDESILNAGRALARAERGAP
jgi:hypothetical protein